MISQTNTTPMKSNTSPSDLFNAILMKKWANAYIILMDKSNHHQATYTSTYFGCNALHLACYHATTPFSLIQLLLEISPSSVLVQDKFGQTPLRIALERESSTDDVILALIKACPQVAEVNDSDGTSPLSYAVKAGKSLKVTTALREVRPSFVYWKNKMILCIINNSNRNNNNKNRRSSCSSSNNKN